MLDKGWEPWQVAGLAIFLGSTAIGWLFCGGYSSTTVSYDPAETEELEQARRNELPKNFLPLHQAARMVSLQEEERDSVLGGKSTTVTASFVVPLVASSVVEFYDTQLKSDGWTLKKKEQKGDDETLEVTKGNLTGLVHSIHEDAGSELDLSLTTKLR